MGDSATPTGPHSALLVQLNRFTSQGKFGTKVWTGDELASGTLPSLAALTALFILQARLAVSMIGIPDLATVRTHAEISAVIGNPSSYVAYVTKNEPSITATIKAYADAQRLASWPPGADTTIFKFSNLPIVAAAALALWILAR
jgi:hypothetical protein